MPRAPGQVLLSAPFAVGITRRVCWAAASDVLGTFPAWVHQRQPDERRVEEIAGFVLAQVPDFPPGEDGLRPTPLPGCVTTFSMHQRPVAQSGASAPASLAVAPPQPRGLIDGQHRLLALGRAAQTLQAGARARQGADGSATASDADFGVLVEDYVVTSWDSTKSLFLQLNRAETVPEIDLPDALAPQHKATIDAAVASLVAKYPRCFSSSARCRAPNLHAPSLRTALMATGVVQRRLWTSPQLCARLEALNSRLSTMPNTSFAVNRRGQALRKARDAGFFLGMSASWLDDLDA